MSSADLTLTIDRVLPASPERVFTAITDPEMFGRWMGPEGSIVTVHEMAVTIGGKLSFDVALPDGSTFTLFGVYEEIDPPRRLVHSWAMEGDDEISTVVFELEPVGRSTRLILTHHGLTTPEDVSQNQYGWDHQFDRLERMLS
jgi:uncharacterized protein YndB with AHSA1/START domain